jgi:hypothetical protein
MAVGYLGRLVLTHPRGDEGVGFSLPQVNLGLDLAKGEPPGPAEQHDVQSGALDALAECLADVGDQDVADVGPANDGGVGG